MGITAAGIVLGKDWVTLAAEVGDDLVGVINTVVFPEIHSFYYKSTADRKYTFYSNTQYWPRKRTGKNT